MRLDVSSESSARQRSHMKNQALFSSKDKSKKLNCRLLQFFFGALRVNQACIHFLIKVDTLKWICIKQVLVLSKHILIIP